MINWILHVARIFCFSLTESFESQSHENFHTPDQPEFEYNEIWANNRRPVTEKKTSSAPAFLVKTRAF